jgi:hypothetical protein
MTDQAEDWLDEDGYPTDAALKRITEWPWNDILAMLVFARALWHWPSYWTQDGDKLSIATGGWSGNESIVVALRKNVGFWAMTWESSHRSGLYVFDLKRARALEKSKEVES